MKFFNKEQAKLHFISILFLIFHTQFDFFIITSIAHGSKTSAQKSDIKENFDFLFSVPELYEIIKVGGRMGVCHKDCSLIVCKPLSDKQYQTKQVEIWYKGPRELAQSQNLLLLIYLSIAATFACHSLRTNV